MDIAQYIHFIHVFLIRLLENLRKHTKVHFKAIGDWSTLHSCMTLDHLLEEDIVFPSETLSFPPLVSLPNKTSLQVVLCQVIISVINLRKKRWSYLHSSLVLFLCVNFWPTWNTKLLFAFPHLLKVVDINSWQRDIVLRIMPTLQQIIIFWLILNINYLVGSQN